MKKIKQKHLTMRPIILCIILTFTSFNAIGKSKKSKAILGGAGFLISEVDTKQSYTKVSYPNTKSLFLGTLSAQAALEPWLFLEMNVNFGRYQFVRIHNNQLISEKVKRFHIPLVLRLSPLPFFSFGGGFYGSYRLGRVYSVESTLSEIDLTSAHDSGEHGLEGVIGFNFPTLWPDYQLGLDFRTMYSLTERSGEARSWQNVLIVIRRSLF